MLSQMSTEESSARVTVKPMKISLSVRHRRRKPSLTSGDDFQRKQLLGASNSMTDAIPPWACYASHLCVSVGSASPLPSYRYYRLRSKLPIAEVLDCAPIVQCFPHSFRYSGCPLLTLLYFHSFLWRCHKMPPLMSEKCLRVDSYMPSTAPSDRNSTAVSGAGF